MPSTDASDDCNVYDGVVRFFSATPYPDFVDDATITSGEGRPAFDYFRGVAGTWVLAR